MKEIDPHIEKAKTQEEYSMKVMLRVLNKLDEIVEWINKHEISNHR